MKRKYLSVLTMVVTFFILSLFLPTVCADPAVMIYDYTLSPEVFMPGDNGILTLTVKNAEATHTYAYTSTTSTTSAVTTDTIGVKINNIWINPAYDGSKQVKALLNYEDVGYLAPSSSIDIEFEIVADTNISEGLYFPNVRVDVEGTHNEDVTYPIKVKVSNSSVDLLETSVPSKISVSGSTDITLTAVNNREASVDAVTVTPVEVDGIEFAQNSIFVGELDSYSSEEVTISLIPTITGVYNLSFDISFKNGDNLHTNSLEIPIEVIETLDVAPVLYSSSSTIGKGSSSKIRLEIYNAKTESISGVIVTPITDVRISPTQYFIGSMDADDVFSASFNVYTNDLEIGSEYDVDFKVSFKQGNNYYETPAVSSSFKVVKPTAQSDGGGISLIAVLFFVIIVVVLYLFYKRKKRRSIR